MHKQNFIPKKTAKFCGIKKLVFQLIKEEPLKLKGLIQSIKKIDVFIIKSSKINKKFSKNNLISQIIF